MKKTGVRRRAFAAALPRTIPVLAGYGFLGLAYGIYMNVSGFPFWYPMLMGLTIYGGSLEFVAVTMLLSPFAPLTAFLMAVMIQARHLFYGLAMLERYKNRGWKTFYLIFGMSDETFTVNYTAQVPEGVDAGWFMFFVTLLDQSYWVLAAAAGGILGSFIPFSTEGLDFVMTAMFFVIFLDSWKQEKNHTASFIGLGVTLACRLVFGADSFLIPSMCGILLLLTLVRPKLEGKSEGEPKDKSEDQSEGKLEDQLEGRLEDKSENQLEDQPEDKPESQPKNQPEGKPRDKREDKPEEKEAGV